MDMRCEHNHLSKWQPLKQKFIVSLGCLQVRVDLRYVCNHLIKWRLLNKEFNLPDLAYMAVFAKQTSNQPDQFQLQPHPLDLDYE